ncbi:MAG: hypothetical protein P4M12_10195 [Gammaproteobacteria bacterium]|nr:hypothetical protein [Gammaproteobacteria bacterium]
MKVLIDLLDNIFQNEDDLSEEVETLIETTIHWLRQTGILDNVKIYSREHVRDNACYSSRITDKY